MSEITKPIMLDETGKAIIDQLAANNPSALLSSISQSLAAIANSNNAAQTLAQLAKNIAEEAKKTADAAVPVSATADTTVDSIYGQHNNVTKRISKGNMASVIADEIKANTTQQAKVTFGAGTSAELASVVAQQKKGYFEERNLLRSSSDMNSVKEGGSYQYYAEVGIPSNFPSSPSGFDRGFVTVYPYNGGCVQIIHDWTKGYVVSRVNNNYGNADHWSAWKRLDGFGATTEAELASVVAENLYKNHSGDLNDLMGAGIYWVNSIGESAHNPTSDWGYVRVTNIKSAHNGSRYVLQEFFNDGGTKHYIRSFYSGSWHAWTAIKS